MQDVLPSPGEIRSDAARPWLREGLRLAALVGVLAGLGAASRPLAPLVRPPAAETAALDGAGWEGRRLMAQMLWVKTHAVLHAGVEEREARAGEQHTRAGEFHQEGGDSHADDHQHDESCDHEGGHVFVIPPAREDFRGLLGDLEREIKPYTDSQGRAPSRDAEQTIPLYRLMTWADPHFVQGYTVGAVFLSDAGRHADVALQFLHEGERYNPQSFEIQTELGHHYLVYKKAYAAAERHLVRALALVPRDRELSELEAESRQDAYRWLAYTYRAWEKPEQAVHTAREALRVCGYDGSLKHLIDKRGGW